MSDITPELQALRDRMDVLDDQLIQMLGRRQRLATAILLYKRSVGLPLQSQPREWEILRQAERWGKHEKLDPAFVRMLYYLILAHPFKEFDNQHE